MPSKVGIHSISPNITMGLVRDAVSRGTFWSLVKSVDNPGLMVDVKRESPKTKTILRFVNERWDAAQGVRFWTPVKMQAVAREVIQQIFDRTNLQERAAVDWYEVSNEAIPSRWPTPGDPEGLPPADPTKLPPGDAVGWTAFGNYLIELVLEANRRGIKIALPGTNMGTPHFDEMQALVNTGLFGQLKQGGHIWTMHEGMHLDSRAPLVFSGGIPGAPFVDGAGGFVGRYRILYHLLKSRNEVVPLVISEFYAGYGYDPVNKPFVMERIIQYDTQVWKDEYVLAFTPFTVDPSDGWLQQNYNPFYQGELGVLDYLIARKDVPPVTVPTPMPLSACLVGLHGRADGRMQSSDWQVVDIAKIEAVKLLSSASIEDAGSVLWAGDFVMVRLFEDFRSRRITPDDFVSWQMGGIAAFRNVGVRFFEIGNEPNLIVEGLGFSWNNGTEFAQWFMQVYKRLTAIFPDCQFGFPGVSPGATVPGVRMDEWKFLAQCTQAIQLADFMCQHVYWQSTEELVVMGNGVSRAVPYHALAPNKTLYITEFANQSPGVPMDVKGREYLAFYAAMKTLPYVGAAFAFVSSASDPQFKSQVWRDENGVLNAIPAIVGSRIPAGSHKVTARLLNVRLHPWSGKVTPPLVRQLTEGAFVTVQSIYKTSSMRFGWGCLSPDGNEWASMEFLSGV